MARILKTAFLALAASALAACGIDRPDVQQPPPPVVEIAEVLSEPATLWNDFTGRVAAPETVELRPRVSGYIEQVAFTEGELVQRGELLFSIDPRPYRARERAAQADLASAHSQLTLARSQAERARQLLKSRAISRDEFDRLNAALDTAQAAADSAEAALENARLDLQYTQVKAPISGRVGRALITRGNLASADQTMLTTLVSVDPMYVYFESDQKTFVSSRGFFTPEQYPEVRVSLGGESGFPYRGKVDFIDNRLNSHTGTMQFRAVIPNPDDTFKPGQFTRVRMPTEQLERALLISRKAVLTDQDRRFVYVLDEENRVARREVKTGPQMDDLVVVRHGLDSGERIVINGLQKIFAAGVQVEPQLVQMREQNLNRQLAAR